MRAFSNATQIGDEQINYFLIMLANKFVLFNILYISSESAIVVAVNDLVPQIEKGAFKIALSCSSFTLLS